MKNAVLWIICLFISFTGFAQSQSKKDTSIVEKTKIVGHEGITAIDTSSNFKVIYSDLKNGVTALASALKVGTEHVYEVIVKQQVVNSITNVLLYLLISFLAYVSYKLILKADAIVKEEADKYEAITDKWQFFVGMIMGVLVFLVGACFIMATINDTVMGFLNPHFGAIKQVVEIVSELKNK